MVSVVLQEAANNFTDLDQTIDNRPIASVIYSPTTPEESSVTPKRAGEIYIQISEGSPEHKLRMWIGVAVTGNNFVWEEATGVTTPLPETIARTDKVNDFQPYEQTINGNQLLSFVDGGDQTPEQSKLPADYDGQFYIAVRTLGTGEKDVAIWVASGNQWLPILKESVDTQGLAKLAETNVFTEPTQMLGPAEDGRLFSGTRIKRGTVSPIADASWLAKVEGEKTIFFNTGTDPVEVSIWTAISTSGTNPLNQWKMTWSSVGNNIDTSNLAKLDQINTFLPLQRIGVDNNKAFVHTSRKGSYDPMDAASPDILPYSEGELYVREYADGAAIEHQIWIATSEGDTDSWIKIYDSLSSILTVEAKIVELEAYDTTLDGRLDTLEADFDGLSLTLGQVDSDVTALDTDLNIVKNNVTNLDGRVNSNELKIAALETHHTANQETFTSHGERLDTAELDIDNVIVRVGEAESTIVTIPPLKEEVDRISPMVDNLVGFTNNIDSRLTQTDHSVSTMQTTVNNLVSQGGSHNDRITAAQNDADDAWNKGVMVESIATSNRTKITALETFQSSAQTGIDDHEARITTLEGVTTPSFEDLPNTPETLAANKFLVTNDDGTAIIESSNTVQEVSAVVDGVANGNYPVNMNSLGCGTIYTSNDVSSESIKNSPFIFVTPGTTSKVIALSDIQSKASTTLDAVSVREGRTTWICNQETSRSITINAKRGGNTGTQTLYVNKTDHDSIVLEAGHTMILQPTVFGNGSKKWVVVAKIPSGL